jgi:hypothetical protein
MKKTFRSTVCSNCLNLFENKETVLISKIGYNTFSCEPCAEENKQTILKSFKRAIKGHIKSVKGGK